MHDAGLEKEQSLVSRVEHICNPNTDAFFSWARIFNTGMLPKMPEEGVNTLWIAAYTGMTAVVAKLLEQGLEDVEDSRSRNTLIAATERRRIGVIELLLKSDKIRKNVRDGLECTPLYIAVQAKSSAAVKMLLEQPDIDVVSCNPFGFALKYHYRELFTNIPGFGKSYLTSAQRTLTLKPYIICIYSSNYPM